MKILLFALFLIASAVHLYHSWKDDPRRAWTKPALLLLLLAYYCAAAAPELIPVLIAALATSWLGDVLLMPKGTKWFISGGISFLISHILFVFVYVPAIRWEAVLWQIVIPVAVVYAAVSVIVTMQIKKEIPKPMLAAMILYLLANSTMNLFALMQLICCKNAGAALAYLGAIFFFASDCTLYLVRYHKNKDLIFKKHFTVMFTYIAGECLITLGMLLISGKALF